MNPSTILAVFDLVGTFFFALSGGFRAVKYEFDLLGVLVLSIAVGVGGGIMRDAMLGIHPAAALAGDAYMGLCILAGLLVFFFAPRIAAKWDAVMLVDAIGLGVFAAIGASKATQASGTGLTGLILCGTITAVGGGVIRDVLSGEVPAILNSDFYASAAILGSFSFWLLFRLGAPFGAAFVAAATLTTLLRLLAMRYHIRLPRVRRLPASPSQLAAAHRQRRARQRAAKD